MGKATDGEMLERARDAAVAAAWQAARVIRMHAGRIDEDDVHEKGRHDLVTRADEEAQRLITGALAGAFPAFDVLAEEGRHEDPAAVTEGYRWIIDPIDGTTNFTRGVPPYAVSIALQRGAEVVVGVVLDVAREELFTAVRGGGAFRNGARLVVSHTRALGSSLLTTGFPYRAFDHVESYLEVLRRAMHAARGLRRPGAASVDLAYVACGRFDGFFETGLNAWDVAAGALLVEEAGGRVTDYHGAPNPLFARQILASNGLLHAALLDLLAPMRDVRS